jgi:hypothetical protein
MIFAYFLDLWYARNGAAGKNANGDYPLHVICRDPQVSLQVIFFMVARHFDTVTALSGQEEGLYPFQITAVANADLDALLRIRLLQVVADPVSTLNSSKKRRRKRKKNKSKKKSKTSSESHVLGRSSSLEAYSALRD